MPELLERLHSVRAEMSATPGMPEGWLMVLADVDEYLKAQAVEAARASAETEKARRNRIAQATQTLSYSEADAMQQVLRRIGDNGGLIVASRIADEEGITRSVVVNAIRKLESAGIVKGRSLGMKGTRIEFVGVTVAELAQAIDNPRQFLAA